MTKFKLFKAGSFSQEEITDFINSHIIQKDKYLENGDIYFMYKEIDDLGRTPLDQIESIDRAITEAEIDLFASEQGIVESDRILADLAEKIKESSPNDEKEWDHLQKERIFHEGQRTMHEKTIDGRNKQIIDLKLSHQGYVKKHTEYRTKVAKGGKK